MYFLINYLLILPIYAENWAILAAGSMGFYNYRHQSDVCHIYKTLIKNGYKPQNIITMAYDDIAYDKQNRFQGAMYNNPTWDGFPDNVYQGCEINYKKRDVNPINFLNILLGNKDYVPDGYPVLESNEDDNVFIYFSDHGAPGLIAFPFSNLYKDELINAIIEMKEKQMYNKLIFFLETCEAGSIFANISEELNVYALTASNETESSYGTYCPPEDLVNGYRIGTCLADEFSANFVEHLDTGISIKNITLNEQFEIIKQKTKSSHVKKWGDLRFQNDSIGQYFFGNQNNTQKSIQKTEQQINNQNQSFWNSRDIKLQFLLQSYQLNGSLQNFKDLLKEIYERKLFDMIFSEVKIKFNLLGDYYGSENIICLKRMINIFEHTCLKFSDYGLKYVKFLNEVCEKQDDVEQIIKYLISICIQTNQKLKK